MTVQLDERGTPPLAPHIRTILKQVISAGRHLYLGSKEARRSHPIELSISIVTTTEMADANLKFRNKTGPTDVLSFPAISPASGATHRPHILGDIVICLSVAIDQATSYGHSLERELAFLTAHGFLHLIGYDHETSADEEKMIAAQKKILEWTGI